MIAGRRTAGATRLACARVWWSALAGLAVATAGCDLILGLDPVDDGEGRHVSVRRQEVRLRSTVEVRERAAVDELARTSWLVPDDLAPTGYREVPATLGPGNTLEAWVPDGAARPILAYVEGRTTHYLDVGALEVELADVAWGGADAVVAPALATLSFGVTLPAVYTPPEAFRVDVIGPFTGASVLAPEEGDLLGATGVALQPLGPEVPVATLFDVGDTVVVSRLLSTPEAPTYLRLTGALILSDLRQATNGPTWIAGTMEDLSASTQTLDLVSTSAADEARLAAAAPGLTESSEAWRVVASPCEGYADAGVMLAAGDAVPFEGALSISYVNPLPWPTVVRHAHVRSGLVDVEVDGVTGSIAVAAGLVSVAPLPGTNEFVVDRPQAMPTEISLAGWPLAPGTDAAVTLPPGEDAVEFAIAVDRGGCDLYELTLASISRDGDAPLRRDAVHTRSIGPTFRLPRAHLQAGTTYVVRAACVLGGWPGLADGDLVTRAVPIDVGYLDSGLFRITP